MVDCDNSFLLIIQNRSAAVEAAATLPFPYRLVLTVDFLDAVCLPLLGVVIPFYIGVYVVAASFYRSQKGIRQVDDLY